MAKIAIEALGISRSGGGRTSIYNTIKALPAVAPDAQFLVYLSEFEADLASQPQITQRIVPIKNRFLARLYLQTRLPGELRQQHVDLVHFTKNLMISGISCARVVTVHDLTTLLYPETQSRIDVAYWRWIEPRHVKQADQIIAVSADAARDLTRIYGIAADQIRVVHWAVGDQYRQAVGLSQIEALRTKYQLPDRYVLFLGILAKKKNLQTLLKAMQNLAKTNFDHHLVIAGRVYSQSDASHELSLIQELGLQEKVHYIGEVADADLPALYAASTIYLLPSVHEGFGIPCWEAMALGIPVIASKRGSLPEVVGEAGLLIENPLDVEEWAMAMQRIVRDQELRNRLSQLGRERGRMRSWQTVALETYAVYQTILSQR